MDKDLTQTVQRVLMRHGSNREALVEILHELNAELGYLSQATLALVAEALKLPSSQVLSVASFYSMLDLEPRGTHVIKFCQDAPCHVAGGARCGRRWSMSWELASARPRPMGAGRC